MRAERQRRSTAGRSPRARARERAQRPGHGEPGGAQRHEAAPEGGERGAVRQVGAHASPRRGPPLPAPARRRAPGLSGGDRSRWWAGEPSCIQHTSRRTARALDSRSDLCHPRRVRRRPRTELLDPGAMLATVHELSPGMRIGLRLTRPSDAPRVRAFLERLSEETQACAASSCAMPEVDEITVQHFTFYNPRERLVLAATAPLDRGGGDRRAWPTSHWSRRAWPSSASSWTRSTSATASARRCSSRSPGCRRATAPRHLRAEMLDHNEPMLRLMQRPRQDRRDRRGRTSPGLHAPAHAGAPRRLTRHNPRQAS